MKDIVDKKSRLLFCYDNLYNMYKRNYIKRFKDLKLVTFNLTFEQINGIRKKRQRRITEE